MAEIYFPSPPTELTSKLFIAFVIAVFLLVISVEIAVATAPLVTRFELLVVTVVSILSSLFL